VFDTEEALQRYLSSGINPSTGGRVAEGMNGETYQMHESKVTVLGRDSVHTYGRGDAPVYHVTLDDGREAWVEAVYVFP